jgi:hypothetical protein
MCDLDENDNHMNANTEQNIEKIENKNYKAMDSI